MTTQQPPKNPTLAAILSFLISGLGQVYNGQIGKGVVIFVVQVINVLLMAIVIGFITYPILWIWSIYDAHKVAKGINDEAAQQMIGTTKVCPNCAERVNSGARVCHFCNYQFMPGNTAISAPAEALLQPAAIAESATYAAPVAAAAPSQPAAAQSKSCPQCGSSSQDDARFCMSCGYSFDAPVAVAVEESVDGVEASIDESLVEQ